MIVVKNISKKLGDKQVLHDISFHIGAFENVGIIGKNGAGKTTLLNIISGILKPDSGFLRIHSAENAMEDYEILRKVTYVSGAKSQLWSEWKLKDSFENCAKMYHINKRDFAERLEKLSEIFEIKDCLNKKVQDLSLGQKMRGEIIYALLPEPEIILLDEAMIGLDVSVKYKIMKLFKEIKEEKKTTMIFTSHNLTEIEKLCDRIILIEEGNIIFDGSIEKIRKDVAPIYRLDIEVEGDFPDLEDLPIEKFMINQNKMSVSFDKQKIETVELLRHISKRCAVKDVKIKQPNLEDTIRKIDKTKMNMKK